MGNKLYEDICERLEKELHEYYYSIKNDKMTPEELSVLDKILHSIKSVSTVKAMEEASEWEREGSSYDGYSNRSSYDGYSNRSSYDNYSNRGGRGRSYDRSYDGRRGRDNDNDGRYSENSYGYSGHSEKDVMMNKLQKMMNESNDQHEREIIQNYMQRL